MRPSRKRALVIWLASIVAIVLFDQLDYYSRHVGVAIPGLGVLEFISWVLLVSLSCYLIAVAIRFILTRLFWRVGRRLALSYFLIGLLPFVFFAVMLLVAGYLMAGVLSQAEFRDERNSMVNRLEQWNLEYALTGVKPPTALPSLEIYDTRDASGGKLPKWLRETSFVGLAERGEQALFVSSRVYRVDGKARTVVFVQPLDTVWAASLEDKNGMMVRPSLRVSQRRKDAGLRIGTSSDKKVVSVNVDDNEPDEATSRGADWNIDDAAIAPVLRRGIRRGVVWGDPTPALVSWEDGSTTDRAFIAFSNPWRNLLDFYFGSSEYVNAMLGIILGIASMLALVYFVAVLLAGGLIFSITRAVNRMDKGTKAVERGDFTYRIGLKPRSQLGEVASSFDRMTASIAGLLKKV